MDENKSKESKSAKNRAGQATEDPSVPIDFATFVLSLSSSAAYHLGLAPHPEGEEEGTCTNLPMAKQTIDILGILQEKTKGNLNSFFKTSLENSRKELLGLFGVGKETADSILLYAGNKLILPIDAYTHRVIARVLNIKGDYDFIQSCLQAILPKQIDVYKEFHALIVEHAKRTCQKNPNCKICRIKPCKYRQ